MCVCMCMLQNREEKLYVVLLSFFTNQNVFQIFSQVIKISSQYFKCLYNTPLCGHVAIY